MEDKEDQDQESIAHSRSKRQIKDRHGRKSAFERFRELKGAKHKYEVGEIDKVYEEVEEREYAKRRQNRLEEDWIVDDDGSGYVEDGREIFDEDDKDDEIFVSNKSAGNKKKGKLLKSEKSPVKNGGHNIKSMFANMPTKKRKIESSVKLDADDLLGDILQDLDKDVSMPMPKPTFLKKKPLHKSPIVKSPQNPFSKPLSEINNKPEKITKAHTYTVPKVSLDTKYSPVKNESITSSLSIEPVLSQRSVDEFMDDMDENLMEMIDDDDEDVQVKENNPVTIAPMKDGTAFDNKKTDITEEVIEKNRGFAACSSHKIEPFLDDWERNQGNESMQIDVNIDSSSLPLVLNQDGEQVLRFFWIDAYEDIFNQPGTVFLFGKVWIESAKTHVSCCLTVKNIQRKMFLLPRVNRLNLKTKEEGGEISIRDVYQEFNEVVTKKYKINEFKSKKSIKRYAFEKVGVPSEADYLEVRYSASYPSLLSNLEGETFSHVFGTTSSSLELFLLDQKIKGPCWLDVKNPQLSSPPISWCKVEASIFHPNDVCPTSSTTNIPLPPLVVMTLATQTTINSKSHQNEIAIVGCLVHNNFSIDKPAPNPPFEMHFCALTKPTDACFPYDIKTKLEHYNGTKVEKMDSERALLAFLLAKIQKIDPDVIVGHGILGFDIGILLHRIQANKIPHWSRLGRLKRSQMPKLGNKGMAERQAHTGRLLCDAKLSAKELIRSKSYDLGPLSTQVLKVSEEACKEYDIQVVKKMFDSSTSILELINRLMQNASFTIKIVAELNVLPLALQITNIAGNVMSRTLLGGRSERNEFLLLHAFTEKNFICPDKQIGKPNSKEDKSQTNEPQDDSERVKGKKKPSYAGGLVLDPKKGFYDTFILLMDFNSLYPSIIQEFNICFTTVELSAAMKDGCDENNLPAIPQPDLPPGILPTEIRKLVESRRAVKDLMKQSGIAPDVKQQYNIRQQALKLTANSMYGCLGFSFSRFYAKHLAALVTGKGREILLNTRDLVQKMSYDVIYGDTDSIMINTNCTDYDTVFKTGSKIKTEINRLYKQLEIDIDGVFKYMLLLKKKKYAAVTISKSPSGSIVEEKEFKGLDIVRRDWAQLSADAGKHILDQILSDQGHDERVNNIHTHLEELKNKLESGKIGLDQLTITKQLTKNPNEYPDKNSLPHVQVALRVNANAGRKLQQGDTVPYIICLDGSASSAMQRAYHVDEVKQREDLSIDVQYYLSQQIHPVVSRLCEPIGGTDSARIADCLGLDASSYRSKLNEDENEDIELSEESNEEKFLLCERFKFLCSNSDCDIVVAMDSPTRGSGSSEEFILQSCPNPKCKTEPHENVNSLLNKLRLTIRKHITMYYNSWLLCEEPTCGARVRRISLNFRSGYPVCTVCEKAIMFREYSESDLYKQLCFYEYIFDFNGACQREKNLRHKGEIVKSAYSILYNEVQDQLDLNGYSVVNLGKIFSALHMKSSKQG